MGDAGGDGIDLFSGAYAPDWWRCHVDIGDQHIEAFLDVGCTAWVDDEPFCLAILPKQRYPIELNVKNGIELIEPIPLESLWEAIFLV